MLYQIIAFIFIVLIICASSVVGVYFCLIGSPSNKSEQKIIYIEEGNSYSSIASLLKENNLIKSEFAYKIYLKLNTPSEGLEFGQYVLKTNYDVEELLSKKEFFVVQEVMKAKNILNKYAVGKLLVSGDNRYLCDDIMRLLGYIVKSSEGESKAYKALELEKKIC